MSQTTVSATGGTTTVTDGVSSPTVVQSGVVLTTEIVHGTISQPYTGPQIYVQASAPASPIVNDVWFDTSP